VSWVAVAVAGGAVLNYIGSRSASKKQQPLIRSQTDLANQQLANMKTLSPYIGQYYQRAGEAFDPAFEHYRALASGDRSQIMGAVAPQLADINSRYGSLITASRNLAPRSGAGAAYNTDLGFRAADEGQRVIDQERAGAYPALSAMAGQAANIGSGATGGSTNAGLGAGTLDQSAFNMGRTAAGDQSAAQQQMAQALFNAWQEYKNNNGGGGNGKPASGGAGGTGGGG